MSIIPPIRLEQYLYATLGLPFRGNDHLGNPGLTIGEILNFSHTEDLCLGIINLYVSFADRMISIYKEGSDEYLKALDKRCLTYEEWKRVFAPIDEGTLFLQRSMQYLFLTNADEVSAFTSLFSSDVDSYLKFIMEESTFPHKEFFFSPLRLSIPITSFSKHSLILAKTGIGKSTLIGFLFFMIAERTANRKNPALGNSSVVLIDPHADLADAIKAQKWSKSAQERLVFFDPFLAHRYDEKRYPCFNPLEVPKHLRHDEVFLDVLAGELVESLKVLVQEASLSLYMKTILEPVIYTLLCNDHTDLHDLVVFLDDNRNDAWIEKGCQSPNRQHADFFKHQFSNKEYNKTKVSIMTRLQSLFNRLSFTRSVTGASTFSIERCLREGKILVFSLSRTDLGKEGGQVLCRLFLSMINVYLMRYGKLPPEKRKKTFLFIDEFQTMATSLFSEMLTQSRKFGASLILSHQQTGQLDGELLESVLSNTDMKIVGRNGTTTLKKLASEMLLRVERLQSLDNYEFVAKLENKSPLSLAVPRAFLKSPHVRLNKEELNSRDRWLLFDSGYYRLIDQDIEELNVPDSDVRDQARVINEDLNDTDATDEVIRVSSPKVEGNGKASKGASLRTEKSNRRIKKRSGDSDVPPPSAPPPFNF